MLINNFLNKLSIITKVNIIFFISILTILIYTFITVKNNYKIYKNVVIVEKASNISLIISSLIHEIQRERGLSSGYVSSKGSKFFKDLEIQIQKTNEKIYKLNHSTFFKKNKVSLLNVNQIQKIREKIKQRTIKNDEIIKFYSNINATLLQFIFKIFKYSLNQKIYNKFLGYLNFLYAKEYLGIQRAITVNILSKGYLEYQDILNLTSLIAKQQIYIKSFLRYTDEKAKKKYDTIIQSQIVKKTNLITKELLQTNKTNGFKIGAVYAFNTFTQKINLYKDIESFLANHLMNDAKQLKKEVELKFLFYSFLSALIILFLLVIKHFTGLNIYKTMKKLNRLLTSFDKNVIASNTDKNGFITYVSEAFCKLTGYTKKELLGRPHNIIKHPDTSKELSSTIWFTITRGNIYEGEIKNKKKDGEFYWLKVIISPEWDNKKNITGYSAVAQDITDKKELEELSHTLELKVKARTIELEREKSFIDTVLNTQEQIIITSDGKTIKSVNDAFMKFYNIKTLKEFTDMYSCICETFSLSSPQDYLQSTKDVKWTKQILDNPNIQHKAMLMKDGIEHIFSVTLSETNIENEIFEIVVFSDITEIENAKKEIEKQVEDGLSEIKSLNEEITDTQKEIVFTMGTICEKRSKETGNHVKRVAKYSELLALKYGMDPKEAKLLKEASPMHDIGKIAISDNILKKPGKLTKKEFEEMQKHTQIGFDIFKTSQKEILKIAAIVAKEHHEKYDGTGYPNKLKENEIHIYGRITAIADVFDALGSDRCYKKAWNNEKIFQFFKDERGKHFDPELIDIFFNNLDHFLSIRETYKERV